MSNFNPAQFASINPALLQQLAQAQAQAQAQTAPSFQPQAQLQPQGQQQQQQGGASFNSVLSQYHRLLGKGGQPGAPQDQQKLGMGMPQGMRASPVPQQTQLGMNMGMNGMQGVGNGTQGMGNGAQGMGNNGMNSGAGVNLQAIQGMMPPGQMGGQAQFGVPLPQQGQPGPSNYNNFFQTDSLQGLQGLQGSNAMGMGQQPNLPQQQLGMNQFSGISAQFNGLPGMNNNPASNANNNASNNNFHSGQQGLGMPGYGAGESDQGRRQALQDMLQQPMFPQPPLDQLSLSAQNQRRPGDPPPPHQPPDLNGSLPQQQQQQQSQQNRVVPPELHNFLRARPQLIQSLLQKYNGNQAAMLHELIGIYGQAQQGQATQPQQQAPADPQQVQQPQQQMDQNSWQQQPAQQQQQRSISQVGINGMNGMQQGQQAYAPPPQQQQQRPPPMNQPLSQGMPNHQRMISGSFETPPMGDMHGVPNFDQKQFEALQAMKERQQRQGLVTPQMGQPNALPLVSPQPRQASQPPPPAQLPPSAQPMQPPARPQPQRQMSNSSILSQPSAQLSQNAVQNLQNKLGSVPNESVARMASTMASRVQGQQSVNDPMLWNLVMAIAEMKKRGLLLTDDIIGALNKAYPDGRFTNHIMNAEWQTISDGARKRSEQLATARLSQAQVTMQQQQPQNMATPAFTSGSSNNPIDIVTPSQQTNVALPIPGSASSMSSNQSGALAAQLQQLQHQQAKLQTPQGQQAEWQRSASISSQSSQMTSQPPAMVKPAFPPGQPRPWNHMDFKAEIIPFNEDAFYRILAQMRGRDDRPNLPMIEGKSVNLWLLFSIVHKNGGGVKMWNNIAAWQMTGGLLGFGGIPAQPGQPPKAAAQVAAQLRNIYVNYCQAVEDRWYQSLFNRLNTNPAAAAPTDTPVDGGAVIPPQLLEALSKSGGNARVLEDLRRQAQSHSGQSTPTVQAAAPVPSAQPPPATPGSTFSSALFANPQLAYSWIRSKEQEWQTKLPSVPRQVPEQEMPQLNAIARELLGMAKEARDKMPQFLLVAAAKGGGLLETVGRLVQLYMWALSICQSMEKRQPTATLTDVTKLKMALKNFLEQLNTAYKAHAATANGYAALQALKQNAPAPMPTPTLSSVQPLPAPGPTNPAAMDESLASKLPKGLRMEDLKQPPAKRQKGPATKATGSPTIGAAATAEAKTTPTGGQNSPAGKKPTDKPTPGSTAANNKRKRQPSTASSIAKTPKTGAGATPTSKPIPTPTEENKQLMGPPQLNALGIDLSAKEEQPQSAFWERQSTMEAFASGKGDDIDLEQVLGFLAEQMADYRSTTSQPLPASLASAAATLASGAGTSHNLLFPLLSSSLSGPAPGEALQSPVLDPSLGLQLADGDVADGGLSIQELMEWIERDPSPTEETPELVRVESAGKDTSPDSIKSTKTPATGVLVPASAGLGSGAGLGAGVGGRTQWGLGLGNGGEVDKDARGVDEEGASSLGLDFASILGWENGYYNGSVISEVGFGEADE